MPIIPNASRPQEDPGPSPEEQNPTKYRFEGFDLNGINQGILFRDMNGDTLIWKLREVSQPEFFSRRSVSSFTLDMRKP